MKNFVLALLLAISGLPALAQASVSTPQPIAVTASYLLAPADVLNINVVNFPNLSVPQAVVAPDGTVAVPLLNTISVTGLTTAQASHLLTQKWRKYVINPAVSVSLMEKHVQNVVFSGWLNHPGTVAFRPGLHLLDALAEVGGSATTGDPTNATLTRADGSKQVLDLTHPEKKTDDPNVNLELAPGDVLYIPEQQNKVSVVGQVKQPGSVDWNDHLTVLEAINQSGGVTLDTADLKAAKLMHNGVETPIDLDAMLLHGDLTQNIKLSPSDSLNIPELHNRVYVFGDVNRPGWYYFKPNDRITDALGGVGGPTPQADLGKVNVIHTNNAKNNAQMVKVSLNEFLLKGNLSGNPYIGAGDSLYIPDKHNPFGATQLLQILQGVGSIAYTSQVTGIR